MLLSSERKAISKEYVVGGEGKIFFFLFCLSYLIFDAYALSFMFHLNIEAYSRHSR